MKRECGRTVVWLLAGLALICTAIAVLFLLPEPIETHSWGPEGDGVSRIARERVSTSTVSAQGGVESRSIRVRVIDDVRDTALFGVRVGLESVGSRLASTITAFRATGPQGLVVLELPADFDPAGAELRCRHDGYEDAVVTFEPAMLSGEEVLIRLRGAGTIAGTVDASSNRVRAEDIRALALLTGDQRAATVPVVDGQFRIDGLDPRGTYVVSVRCAGFLSDSAEGVVPRAKGAAPWLTFRLRAQPHDALWVHGLTGPEMTDDLHVVATDRRNGKAKDVRLSWSSARWAGVTGVPDTGGVENLHLRIEGGFGQLLFEGAATVSPDGGLHVDLELETSRLALVLPVSGGDRDSLLQRERLRWRNGMWPRSRALDTAAVDVHRSSQSKDVEVDLTLGQFVARGVHVLTDATATFSPVQTGSLRVIDVPEETTLVTVLPSSESQAARQSLSIAFPDAPSRVAGGLIELPPGGYRLAFEGVERSDVLWIRAGEETVVSLAQLRARGALRVRFSPSVASGIDGAVEIRLLDYRSGRAVTKAAGAHEVVDDELSLSALPIGEFTLRLDHAVRGRVFRAVTVSAETETLVTIDAWPPLKSARVQFVDADGTPVSGKDFRVHAIPRGFGSVQRTRTNSGGIVEAPTDPTLDLAMGSSDGFWVLPPKSRRLDPVVVRLDDLSFTVQLRGWWADRVGLVQLLTERDGVIHLRSGRRSSDNEFEIPAIRDGDAVLVQLLNGEMIFICDPLAGVRDELVLRHEPSELLVVPRLDSSTSRTVVVGMELESLAGVPMARMPFAGLVSERVRVGQPFRLRGRGPIAVSLWGEEEGGGRAWRSSPTHLTLGPEQVAIQLRLVE